MEPLGCKGCIFEGYGFCHVSGSNRFDGVGSRIRSWSIGGQSHNLHSQVRKSRYPYLDRMKKFAFCRYFPTVLSNADCESLYELVFTSHRGLAMAAGEFLNVRLFMADSNAPGGRSKKGKARSANTPMIRALVCFFIEADVSAVPAPRVPMGELGGGGVSLMRMYGSPFQLHEHGAYLVDALIDSNDMVKDWECMTDLLLEEPGMDGSGQNEEREWLDFEGGGGQGAVS